MAWRTSTRIILRASVDQVADWIFYEEYCLRQAFCMTDHLIIQLTYPEFHLETETEVDNLTGLQRHKDDYEFEMDINNIQACVVLDIK